MATLETVERLASALARLPGVGRRSAQRMAQRIARDPGRLGADILAAIQEVRQSVAVCGQCGALTLKEKNPCGLCSDPGRDQSVLCVVEDASDIALIEQAGGYNGRYHALMGKLSPMRGEGPANPRFAALLARVQDGPIREVILALNADVESDATATYLHDELIARKVVVSRLALGIPAGSGVAYADPVTLSRAIRGRQEF
jgi:recombination protein RecR